MEIFALDLGNIQTKIKSSMVEKVLPSKFLYYEDLGDQSTSISGSNLDIKEYTVSFDDAFTYAWGKDLYKTNVTSFIDTINFENRYESNEFKLLSTFAIGELAMDFKEAKDSILEVDIVTGVPTNDFNRQSVESIIKVLKVDHNVTINGTRLNVRVNEVKVVPQPVGTVYNEMLDQEGFIKEESYETESISIVDCGGGTILIDTLNNMNLSETGRAQYQKGAYSIYDYIVAKCKEEQIIIAQYDVETILREQNDEFYYKPNKNESLNITPIVKRAKTRYTRDLINLVDATLKDTSHIDTQIFTGGGANLIDQKEVKSRFKHAIFINNSEVANVNGFYKYGIATAESDDNEG